MGIITKRQFLMYSGAAVMLTPVSAMAEDDLMKKLINKPDAGAWAVYGQGQTNKKVKDKEVTGGGATQVKVTTPTASGSEWQISASAPVEGAFKKGDKLLVAAWLKASETEGGVPGKGLLRFQINAAPYTGIGQKSVSISDKWALYSFEAIADADHDKGTTNVSLQLGFAKQTISLGPLLVLNFGQNA